MILVEHTQSVLTSSLILTCLPNLDSCIIYMTGVIQGLGFIASHT